MIKFMKNNSKIKKWPPLYEASLFDFKNFLNKFYYFKLDNKHENWKS